MRAPELFLDGRVALHRGDSREVLRQLADASIDSCVTDPPYALVSIGKRFGGASAAPATSDGASGVYKRASAGFMGQQWDTGETAFDPAFWREVLRVLKPGGHVVSFSATRTYHRLACAVEDAGFEIRDMVSWLYGSGFPKSHDVSKGIDKRKDWTALPKLQSAIRSARKALGISQSEAARRCGLIGPGESLGGGGFMWFETGMRLPTREQWPALKAALRLGGEFDRCFEEAEREITGTVDEWSDRSNYALTSRDGFRRDKPSSEAVLEWQGWGTALKPACEPMVLARKPLDGTVAETVLRHGTGAINVDACRVGTETRSTGELISENGSIAGGNYAREIVGTVEGRWPANVVHDGSDEVVAAFPSEAGAQAPVRGREPSALTDRIYGARQRVPGAFHGDSGSAARFFYSAKADAHDRVGSKHPTVKPIDLMQWLVRLITPPGGTVLDPFAGTGTTGEAAWREGFSAVLIERETQYAEDIARRMALCLAGPSTRRAESAKARGRKGEALPLFGDDAA
jgi:DNA modification methylase/transcriptional regulator with XRE-family HTH domain